MQCMDLRAHLNVFFKNSRSSYRLSRASYPRSLRGGSKWGEGGVPADVVSLAYVRPLATLVGTRTIEKFGTGPKRSNFAQSIIARMV